MSLAIASRGDDGDRRRSMPARDDDGRFTSSRSRYDDDADDRRGSREHGGWYGDPEGHSPAARRRPFSTKPSGVGPGGFFVMSRFLPQLW